MENKIILGAVAEVLKDEREKTDSKISEINAAVEKRLVEIKDGKDGAPGKDGKPGVDGVPGKDGEKGLDGKPGKDGEPGAPGKDGKPGVDGVPGKDGEKGLDGKPGKDGEPGAPGKDGIDKVTIAPRFVDFKKSIGPNEIVYFDGGLFQTIRKTLGNPIDDPHSYRLIVNGISDIEYIEDIETRERSIISKLSDGQEHEIKGLMQPMFLGAGIESKKILKDDYYIDFKKQTLNIALKEDPETADDWQSMLLKGQRGRTGKKGDAGPTGPQGVGIKNIETDKNGLLLFELTNGKFLDVQVITPQDIFQEIKNYEGSYQHGKAYPAGAVVTASTGLHLALKNTSDVLTNKEAWAQMLSRDVGGGGGVGGGALLWPPNVTAPLDMYSFGIRRVADPRPGAIGEGDAINRLYMEQSIAAGALYQGLYKPAINSPDLWQLLDNGFTPPVANQQVNDPPWAPANPDPLDITVWFDMGPVTFPLTLNAPDAKKITYSDGKIEKFNVAAGTYNLLSDYQNEINTHIPNLQAVDVTVYDQAGNLWFSVETVAPVYCTFLTGQTASPFAGQPTAPGPGNKVLNTYNWVVSTVVSTVDEAAPPGIPGIAPGIELRNSDLLQWNGTTNQFDLIRGGSITQDFSDRRYWQLQGANFRYVDQAYIKNSVVWDEQTNAWFYATQNIPAGSPKPGTTAAAAIWRKINSTYGATVFFGRGDYDPSDTTAANNWGMPAGVYPAGQQPLQNDSYFDILTGSVTDFAVTHGGNKYTIDGTIDLSNPANSTLGMNWNQVFQNWPANMPQGNTGVVYNKDSGPVGRSLFGTPWANTKWDPVAPNKLVYFSFVGDPDADAAGWVLMWDDGTPNWKDYSLTTPHAQVIPDTIAAHTTWGFRRNFEITIDAGAAAGDKIIALKNLGIENYIAHVEVYEDLPNGSNYEFTVNSSTNDDGLISPRTVDAHNSYFDKIHLGHEAALGRFITFEIKATAAGKKYKISIESQTMDLGQVQAGDGTQKEASSQDNFDAAKDYPSDELTSFFKAASGDAAASIPHGKLPGENFGAQSMQTPDGQAIILSGYFLRTARGDAAPVLVRFTDETGASCDQSKWEIISAVRHETSKSEMPITKADIIGSPGNDGWVQMTKGGPRIDKWSQWYLMIDRRDPVLTFFHWWFVYIDESSGQYIKDEVYAHVEKANAPAGFYFAGWSNETHSIRAYKSLT